MFRCRGRTFQIEYIYIKESYFSRLPMISKGFCWIKRSHKSINACVWSSVGVSDRLFRNKSKMRYTIIKSSWKFWKEGLFLYSVCNIFRHLAARRGSQMDLQTDLVKNNLWSQIVFLFSKIVLAFSEIRKSKEIEFSTLK